MVCGWVVETDYWILINSKCWGLLGSAYATAIYEIIIVTILYYLSVKGVGKDITNHFPITYKQVWNMRSCNNFKVGRQNSTVYTHRLSRSSAPITQTSLCGREGRLNLLYLPLCNKHPLACHPLTWGGEMTLNPLRIKEGTCLARWRVGEGGVWDDGVLRGTISFMGPSGSARKWRENFEKKIS